MDRLTPLDDLFVSLERDELPMHIGSLLIFDGPAPDYDDLLASMAGRIHRIPRYRQRLREVPLSLGLPVWQDDPHFTLAYHVRHTAVPPPGGHVELRTLAGRLLSQRLDVSRPLWEMWLIEGLADGQFAVLNKVHHAMIDGLSGADLTEVLLDADPDAAIEDPQPWTPRPEASAISMMTTGVMDSVRDPVRTARTLADGLQQRPKDFARSATAAVVGTVKFGQELAHTEDQLIGRPGPHRRWDWAVGDLGEVKRIKNSLGGTVNDVILTAVTGGFRKFLVNRGVELTEEDTVRTMVPVSTRPSEGQSGGNAVAALFADLPVGIADAGDCLEAMKDQMSEVKSSGMLEGTDALVGGAIFIPPLLWAAAGRIASRAPQPSVATITTNVPGPQQELYMLGRPLLTILPYVPLGMNQLVTVAIFSYNGGITCGITADYDRVPDVDVLARGIESSLAELSALA
ncbi:MAG: wax ester/triacylglycerol synthase family O-acyltransferase [Candidatus Nanopelagicales bacterium]